MSSRHKLFAVLVGCFAALSGWVSSQARADVRLPGLFTDHMVLQQGMQVPVWGWADEGEEVTVSFRGQRVTTRAKDGKWMVRLKPLKAGGPDVLTVSGRNTVEVNDVLVGEVWVCSGQSNMNWPMTRAENPESEIAAAGHPNLRLFAVPAVKSDEPLDDVKSAWTECTPATVASFSAVAYYFGRDLANARNVPVGLIHTSWGGSPAEAWMSRETLDASPVYRREILDEYTGAYRRYEAALARYEQRPEAAGGAKVEKPTPPRWKPAELFNGKLAPVIPYAIKGAIWYQGESNASRAAQYRSLFADMIRDWRGKWGQGDFAFLAVQLAPFDKGRKRSFAEIAEKPGDSDWAELREAQLLATQVLPKVGMAVITDAGTKDDIHPPMKEPVGARLALAARGIAYGEKIVHSGPVFKRMVVRGSEAVLSFDHVGAGLESRGGPLVGFSVCGADGNFAWADARIERDKVVVSSPYVPHPVAVRYGWADYPLVNLWNKDGLPATPFRTDQFPLITAGAK